MWPIAWIALVPLFVALKGKRVRYAFILGFISGLTACLGCLRWFPSTVFNVSGSRFLSVIGWIIASIYPAISAGVFSAAHNFIRKHLIDSAKSRFYEIIYMAGVPSMWAALEFLQFKSFKGFPWIYNFLSETQWNNIRVIQISSFTSHFGVSFLIVLVNLGVYRFLSERKFKPIIAAAAVLMISLIYGVWIVDTKAPKTAADKDGALKITILRGNIDAKLDWKDKERAGNYIAHTYLDLCKEAVKEKPDLVVWTETAIPWPMADGDDLIEQSLKITAPSGACHIIGMPASADEGLSYDSAFFVMPDGLIIDRYDKVNLLDFMEAYRRTSKIAKFLKLDALTRNYLPGKYGKILKTPLGKIGVLICNENLYPDYARKITRQGAEFLITMANDNLLTDKIIIEHHFIVNYFRAIENRRDVVIAANSGISGLIDAYGRLIKVSAKSKSECISCEVKKRNYASFYSKFGDLFIYFCVFCSISGVVISSYVSFRRRKTS